MTYAIIVTKYESFSKILKKKNVLMSIKKVTKISVNLDCAESAGKLSESWLCSLSFDGGFSQNYYNTLYWTKIL